MASIYICIHRVSKHQPALVDEVWHIEHANAISCGQLGKQAASLVVLIGILLVGDQIIPVVLIICLQLQQVRYTNIADIANRDAFTA